MRLLITALLSITALLADPPQRRTVQPKQLAKTGTHNNVAGARSPGPPKPVHVCQYTRKDGTVVRAHNRAAPGTASKSRGGAIPQKAPPKIRVHTDSSIGALHG